LRSDSRHLVLSVPCDVAYDFLADYRNDLLWRPELKTVSLKSGTAGEPGAVYEASLEWYGITGEHELVLVECTRPRQLHARSQSANLCIDVVYTLHDGEDRCLLTVDYMLAMDGPLVLLEPFGWSLLMGWVNDDLPRLEKAVAG